MPHHTILDPRPALLFFTGIMSLLACSAAAWWYTLASVSGGWLK